MAAVKDWSKYLETENVEEVKPELDPVVPKLSLEEMIKSKIDELEIEIRPSSYNLKGKTADYGVIDDMYYSYAHFKDEYTCDYNTSEHSWFKPDEDVGTIK